MVYRTGNLIFIISALGVVAGSLVLTFKRRVADLLLFYILFLSGPAYVKFIIMPITNPEKRLWLAIPAAILIPAWALSGIYLGRLAFFDTETTLVGDAANILRSFSVSIKTKKGIVGAALFIVATISWIDIAMRFSDSDKLPIPALVFIMYSWVLGLYWMFFAKHDRNS